MDIEDNLGPVLGEESRASLGSSGAGEFFSRLCLNPSYENAWLEALAHMETLAAQQIRGNISRATPVENISEIEAHANDELRHAQMLLAMRTNVPAESALREIFCRLGESFVVGYFANPELVRAKDRHCAYTHGALTIEQFPFQIYTHYLRFSTNQKVLSELPKVIHDEAEHLRLGRKLLAQIPLAERLSMTRLMQIERDMCCLFIEKCARSLPVNLLPIESSPHRELQKPTLYSVCWLEALAHGEEAAAAHMMRLFVEVGQATPERLLQHELDEKDHANRIRKSIVLEKWRHRRDPSYERLKSRCLREMDRYLLKFFHSLLGEPGGPEVHYVLGALALERRAMQHLSEVIKWHPSILASHTLREILSEEAQHLEMQTKQRLELGIAKEDEQRIVDREAELFHEMQVRVAEFIA